MLPVIKSLWIGRLTRIEKICLKSLMYHGHKVELYVYDDITDVPDGVTVKDANEVLDQSKVFVYGEKIGAGRGSVAGFANHFRYKMLYNSENAFWVDMDVLCLKPFEFNKDLVFGWQDEYYINNAVIGTRKLNHNLFNELITYCENPFKLQHWDGWKLSLRKLLNSAIRKNGTEHIPWGLTGPKALTGYVNKHGLERYSVSKHIFYPIKLYDWKKIFFEPAKKVEPLISDSYAIHLWHEKMRRVKFNKNTRFDKNSIFEILAEKYE